jgi:hypothetical protein
MVRALNVGFGYLLLTFLFAFANAIFALTFAFAVYISFQYIFHGILSSLKIQLKITLQQAAVPPLAGFPVGDFNRSIIGSLTPHQAAGNALAIAVQRQRNRFSAEPLFY